MGSFGLGWAGFFLFGFFWGGGKLLLQKVLQKKLCYQGFKAGEAEAS